MSFPPLLDHVVVAGPDLGELVAWFAAATGVTAAPGGVHPDAGTANALVALTVAGGRRPHYVELIGPDPGATVGPAIFGIAALTAPRVVTYAEHPADLDATVAAWRERGQDPGPVAAMSRRTPDGTLLSWRLTRPRPGRPDVPFLIDWGTTPHPGTTVGPALDLLGFGPGAGGAGFVLRVRGADGSAVALGGPAPGR